MVVRCYCCKKRFKSNLEHCPYCQFQNLKHSSWLPEELKIEHAKNHVPVNKPPTVSEFQNYVYKAAKDCEFNITALNVNDTFEGVIEVLQHEDDFYKLEINYNPQAMRRFTTKEILAMLRHELMHPITMQESSKIAVSEGAPPEMQKLQAAVQEAYDEMINYKEYSKRFPHDEDFRSMKQKMYTNFSIIFLSVKHNIENGLIQNDHPDLFVHALTIYEDAVYNFFEDSEKLKKWANENSAHALYEYFKWIHEDFNIIQENVSSRDDMRKIIFLTFKMMVTVSIAEIYTSNKIVFNEMWTTAYQHCQENYADSLGVKLLALWKKRYDESPKKFP